MEAKLRVCSSRQELGSGAQKNRDVMNIFNKQVSLENIQVGDDVTG